MKITKSLSDYIVVKQLKRYGHDQKMGEDRLLKQVMPWYPIKRKKRKGRSKNTWTNGIRRMMGEMGLMEGNWRDRDNWKIKISCILLLLKEN